MSGVIQQQIQGLTARLSLLKATEGLIHSASPVGG